uniref:SPOC domain-containing protein n=1 Tax=Anopheles atroparvus TaxID=41427 RepID=A0A182J2U4_ANOAO
MNNSNSVTTSGSGGRASANHLSSSTSSSSSSSVTASSNPVAQKQSSSASASSSSSVTSSSAAGSSQGGNSSRTVVKDVTVQPPPGSTNVGTVKGGGGGGGCVDEQEEGETTLARVSDTAKSSKHSSKSSKSNSHHHHHHHGGGGAGSGHRHHSDSVSSTSSTGSGSGVGGTNTSSSTAKNLHKENDRNHVDHPVAASTSSNYRDAFDRLKQEAAAAAAAAAASSTQNNTPSGGGSSKRRDNKDDEEQLQSEPQHHHRQGKSSDREKDSSAADRFTEEKEQRKQPRDEGMEKEHTDKDRRTKAMGDVDRESLASQKNHHHRQHHHHDEAAATHHHHHHRDRSSSEKDRRDRVNSTGSGSPARSSSKRRLSSQDSIESTLEETSSVKKIRCNMPQDSTGGETMASTGSKITERRDSVKESRKEGGKHHHKSGVSGSGSTHHNHRSEKTSSKTSSSGIASAAPSSEKGPSAMNNTSSKYLHHAENHTTEKQQQQQQQAFLLEERRKEIMLSGEDHLHPGGGGIASGASSAGSGSGSGHHHKRKERYHESKHKSKKNRDPSRDKENTQSANFPADSFGENRSTSDEEEQNRIRYKKERKELQEFAKQRFHHSTSSGGAAMGLEASGGGTGGGDYKKLNCGSSGRMDRKSSQPVSRAESSAEEGGIGGLREKKKCRSNSSRKANSSDTDDSDEPKKHSIFDIPDDFGPNISMYDKVKARSCKNMQKQEEEKKIRAKFSQLKQCRAKREGKNRSKSWEGDDSDSDGMNSDTTVNSKYNHHKEHNKSGMVTTTDDEDHRSTSANNAAPSSGGALGKNSMISDAEFDRINDNIGRMFAGSAGPTEKPELICQVSSLTDVDVKIKKEPNSDDECSNAEDKKLAPSSVGSVIKGDVAVPPSSGIASGVVPKGGISLDRKPLLASTAAFTLIASDISDDDLVKTVIKSEYVQSNPPVTIKREPQDPLSSSAYKLFKDRTREQQTPCDQSGSDGGDLMTLQLTPKVEQQQQQPSGHSDSKRKHKKKQKRNKTLDGGGSFDTLENDPSRAVTVGSGEIESAPPVSGAALAADGGSGNAPPMAISTVQPADAVPANTTASIPNAVAAAPNIDEMTKSKQQQQPPDEHQSSSSSYNKKKHSGKKEKRRDRSKEDYESKSSSSSKSKKSKNRHKDSGSTGASSAVGGSNSSKFLDMELFGPISDEESQHSSVETEASHGGGAVGAPGSIETDDGPKEEDGPKNSKQQVQQQQLVDLAKGSSMDGAATESTSNSMLTDRKASTTTVVPSASTGDEKVIVEDAPKEQQSFGAALRNAGKQQEQLAASMTPSASGELTEKELARKEESRKRKEKKRRDREKLRASMAASLKEDENSVDLDEAGRALEAQLMSDTEQKEEEVEVSPASTVTSGATLLSGKRSSVEIVDVFRYTDGDDSMEMSFGEKKELLSAAATPGASSAEHGRKEKKKKKKRGKDDKHKHHHSGSSGTVNSTSPATTGTPAVGLGGSGVATPVASLPTASGAAPSQLASSNTTGSNNISAGGALQTTSRHPQPQPPTTTPVTPSSINKLSLDIISAQQEDSKHNLSKPSPSLPCLLDESPPPSNKQQLTAQTSTPSTTASTTAAPMERSSSPASLMLDAHDLSCSTPTYEFDKKEPVTAHEDEPAAATKANTAKRKTKPVPDSLDDEQQQLHEKAVMSISGEKVGGDASANASTDGDQQQQTLSAAAKQKQQLDEAAKLLEEKSRVVISQEETEDAVAALLGESFGTSNTPDFSDMYSDTVEEEQLETQLHAEEPPQIPEEDDEEMKKAIMSLNAEELKPDTPQSEHDLQIDTDTDDALDDDHTGGNLLRFDNPPKTPDVDLSQIGKPLIEGAKADKTDKGMAADGGAGAGSIIGSAKKDDSIGKLDMPDTPGKHMAVPSVDSPSQASADEATSVVVKSSSRPEATSTVATKGSTKVSSPSSNAAISQKIITPASTITIIKEQLRPTITSTPQTPLKPITVGYAPQMTTAVKASQAPQPTPVTLASASRSGIVSQQPTVAPMPTTPSATVHRQYVVQTPPTITIPEQHPIIYHPLPSAESSPRAVDARLQSPKLQIAAPHSPFGGRTSSPTTLRPHPAMMNSSRHSPQQQQQLSPVIQQQGGGSGSPQAAMIVQHGGHIVVHSPNSTTPSTAGGQSPYHQKSPVSGGSPGSGPVISPQQYHHHHLHPGTIAQRMPHAGGIPLKPSSLVTSAKMTDPTNKPQQYSPGAGGANPMARFITTSAAVVGAQEATSPPSKPSNIILNATPSATTPYVMHPAAGKSLDPLPLKPLHLAPTTTSTSSAGALGTPIKTTIVAHQQQPIPVTMANLSGKQVTVVTSTATNAPLTVYQKSMIPGSGVESATASSTSVVIAKKAATGSPLAGSNTISTIMSNPNHQPTTPTVVVAKPFVVENATGPSKPVPTIAGVAVVESSSAPTALIKSEPGKEKSSSADTTKGSGPLSYEVGLRKLQSSPVKEETKPITTSITSLDEQETDSKEDSDCWSAKEINIDSVIKKVDALCSEDEPPGPAVVSQQPVVLDKEASTIDQVAKGSDIEVQKTNPKIQQQQPTTIIPAVTPNLPGPTGLGVTTATSGVPAATSTPKAGGRLGALAQHGGSSSDIYEFHDDSGEDVSNSDKLMSPVAGGDGARPRLILTIKNQAAVTTAPMTGITSTAPATVIATASATSTGNVTAIVPAVPQVNSTTTPVASSISSVVTSAASTPQLAPPMTIPTVPSIPIQQQQGGATDTSQVGLHQHPTSTGVIEVVGKEEQQPVLPPATTAGGITAVSVAAAVAAANTRKSRRLQEKDGRTAGSVDMRKSPRSTRKGKDRKISETSTDSSDERPPQQQQTVSSPANSTNAGSSTGAGAIKAHVDPKGDEKQQTTVGAVGGGSLSATTPITPSVQVTRPNETASLADKAKEKSKATANEAKAPAELLVGSVTQPSALTLIDPVTGELAVMRHSNKDGHGKTFATGGQQLPMQQGGVVVHQPQQATKPHPLKAHVLNSQQALQQQQIVIKQGPPQQHQPPSVITSQQQQMFAAATGAIQTSMATTITTKSSMHPSSVSATMSSMSTPLKLTTPPMTTTTSPSVLHGQQQPIFIHNTHPGQHPHPMAIGKQTTIISGKQQQQQQPPGIQLHQHTGTGNLLLNIPPGMHPATAVQMSPRLHQQQQQQQQGVIANAKHQLSQQHKPPQHQQQVPPPQQIIIRGKAVAGDSSSPLHPQQQQQVPVGYTAVLQGGGKIIQQTTAGAMGSQMQQQIIGKHPTTGQTIQISTGGGASVLPVHYQTVQQQPIVHKGAIATVQQKIVSAQQHHLHPHQQQQQQIHMVSGKTPIIHQVPMAGGKIVQIQSSAIQQQPQHHVVGPNQPGLHQQHQQQPQLMQPIGLTKLSNHHVSTPSPPAQQHQQQSQLPPKGMSPHPMHQAPQIMTGAVASPPLKQSHLQGQQPIVTGASSTRVALPTMSPQGQSHPPQATIQRHILTSQGTVYETTNLGPDGGFRGGMPRDYVKYMYRSNVPRYEIGHQQNYQQQHQLPESLDVAARWSDDGSIDLSVVSLSRSPMRELPEMEETVAASPPLELRRPSSRPPHTIAVPLSLQSPGDRVTDSPQGAQVYMGSARIPHPYPPDSLNARYYEPTIGHGTSSMSASAPLPAHTGGGGMLSVMGPQGIGAGRSIQVATPPGGVPVSVPVPVPVVSAPPPLQTDSLEALLQRYPVMWQGLLALKNDQAAVQMHFVYGNPIVAGSSLPSNGDGSTPPLRIAQRMRLEPAQIDGVARKMQMVNEHCMLLALPCGRDRMDVLQQQNNLQTGFITYLQQKQAAGIVNIAAPGSTQAAYVVHIFPSCEFANENLARIAPDLMHRVANIQYLLIVIATV